MAQELDEVDTTWERWERWVLKPSSVAVNVVCTMVFEAHVVVQVSTQ